MTNVYKRTSMCGSLNMNNLGEHVVLNGWIQKRRTLGGLIFCDLRDKTGLVQVVFDDKIPTELFQRADSLRSEYVVGVKGLVKERTAKNIDLATGDIEVFADDLVIYSEAETPPIYIKDDDNVDENLRLKYRYLDLRKQHMQDNLLFRHKICQVTREYFSHEGFTEVETPMLIKPTPEGARDYLVPSRVTKGSFYALPQSPQMFKQLLMVAGTDRYFQIVKCFRDEDLRADRQPEFTQIDLEMSFVGVDQVLEIQEGFLKKIFKEIMGTDIVTPLPRLTYDEAMERYGSDKPDTRFGFELKRLNDKVMGTEFKIFNDALESDGDVRGICIDGGGAPYTRKAIDKLTETIRSYGATSLIWIKPEADQIASSINKFFSQEKLQELVDVFNAKAGDLILIVAGKPQVVFDSLGFLRRQIAGELGLRDDKQFNLLWVVDFPLYEYDEDDQRYVAKHHPFTSPRMEDLDILESDPAHVKAQAYDIVLNGVEIGGGSIRIHDRSLQQRMFKVLGLSEQETKDKFGFLIEAFKYGAPPHGGIAYGLDRLTMLLTGENSIREVIAFPKNQAAVCLVSEAPSVTSKEQLDELGIELKQ
jgi:aspartyl-tRNA synthetase